MINEVCKLLRLKIFEKPHLENFNILSKILNNNSILNNTVS